MPITLSGTTIKASISTHATNIDLTENEPAQVTLAKTVEIALTAGGGVGAADHVWAENTPALADAGNWDIDLDDGETNVFGDTIAFTEIKLILVYNHPGTGDPPIYVGGAGANEFDSWLGDPSDTVIIPAGGLFLLACPGNATTNGYATAAISSILRIHNSDGAGATANIDVVILGCIA